MRHSIWSFEKPQFSSPNGMVVAKVPTAAAAGAQVLAQGGNAIDAAVTSAFVAGVVEPYMSGIGGGGHMIIHLRGAPRPVALDFAMSSPAAAHPTMFELVDGDERDERDEFFGWRRVRDGQNIDGALAVGVPGTVAGLSLALDRFGTMSLAEVLEPAIDYAENGYEVTWFDTLMIAQHQRLLDRFVASREIFLPDGRVPVGSPVGVPRIKQPALAATLRTIARHGAEAFYQGTIAKTIASDLAAMGGVLSGEDLAGYSAEVEYAPTQIRYRDRSVVGPRALSGSTTVLHTLSLLETFDVAALGHNTTAGLDLLAQASRLAFADRYAQLGALQPLAADRFLDTDYVRGRAELIVPGQPPTGYVAGGEPVVFPTGGPGGSTTHLAAVDADRNTVTLTQTLLQLFGSGVVLPESGVLMNNAMGWFDPEPGTSASIQPARRALSNMSPLLVLRDGEPELALGATGGRKIMQAVLQILLNVVDHGLRMQAAVSAPRIDCSGAETLANARLPPDVVADLKRLGHELVVQDDSFTARSFASPACIRIDADGGFIEAGLDPYYPAAASGV